VSKREFRPDVDYQKAFGQNLRQLRESTGWTQVDLSVYAGVSEYQISVIENGHQGPNFQTLRAIAVALGKYPQELFDFKYTLKLNSNFPTKEKKKPGSTKIIRSLIDNGFFKQQRSVRDVISEIRASFKMNIRTSEVSAVLLALSGRKQIRITRRGGKNYYRQ
jgi:transcriptional regulator with XRE-family HTH domain